MTDIKINLNNDTIYIHGNINLINIMHILCLCINKTENLKNIIVNLENIKNPNSATLIFMINYMKSAIEKNQSIKFINTPTLLSDLSKVYNLNDIIKI